jgi:rhamnosyltransferase
MPDEANITPLNAPAGVWNVGLVIPTLNAGPEWGECLESIRQQSLTPHRRLVIDSSSSDLTAERARASGFEVVTIERSQFNHGGTRQLAIEWLADCDIVVFLTQDAIPAAADSLAELVSCFDDPTVGVAYGRQLPRPEATPIEAHARLFNYGEDSQRKNAQIAGKIGTRVYFCSNSFAAYRRSLIRGLGGFSGNLILGEDMEFAARVVQAGYTNMYCAAAKVYHSHDYSIGQTLRRYFDIGVFDAMNGWMRKEFGSHRGEGLRYVRSELRYLASREPSQIGRALVLTAAKLAGYRLGRIQRMLPGGVKRRLSMTPGFWR